MTKQEFTNSLIKVFAPAEALLEKGLSLPTVTASAALFYFAEGDTGPDINIIREQLKSLLNTGYFKFDD